MENKNASMVYDACVNTYNYNFGKIMDRMASVPEEVKAKFLADLDAKIRAGDLTSDKSVMAYLDSYPELKASIAPEAVSELPKVVKTVAIQNAYIQHIKKAKDYQAAQEKKVALDEKREGIDPLTKEEEHLLSLQRFEAMDKEELNQKIKALAQKEAENKTKPEAERIPLTEDERDLKEFNEIQSQEATAKKWAEETAILRQEGAKEKAPAEKDYYKTLEEANEDFKRTKENYEGFYENEEKELNEKKNDENQNGENDDKSEEKNPALDKAVYAAKKKPELTDPETIDWEKFREEVIWKNLENIGKQGNIADMGFAMFTTVFLDMTASAINNLVKQVKEKNKANEKKEKELRDNTIDTNLKDNSLTRETFARLLAVEAKNWIMDTRDAAKIDLSDPSKLTKREKFLLAKADFVSRLPKTENGDLDFKKFTKKQQKMYDEYVTMYAVSNKWIEKSDQILGMRMTKKEHASLVAEAREARPAGGLEHVYEEIKTKAEKPKAKETVEKVTVASIDQDVAQFVDKLESGRALDKKEQNMLKTALENRGFSKTDVIDIAKTFAEEEAGRTKASEELRKSVLDVIVKGSLDNYTVSDSFSKHPFTQKDNAMISLQADRLTKTNKALVERRKNLNAMSQALAEARNQTLDANRQQMQQRDTGRGY